jgi:hypothetical protein
MSIQGSVAVWNAGPGFRAVWNAGSIPGSTPIWIAGPGFTPIWWAGPGFTPVWLAGCFPKSELVHIKSDEYAPIASLKIGDKISSWDINRKKAQFTKVTIINQYTVNEIICFNGNMRVSSSHPLLVVETRMLAPKWKVSTDVNIGDYIVGVDGKLSIIKSKSKHWYDTGIKVLNLATDNGDPFIVGGCIVRAENANDGIEYADTPITQQLMSA